MPRETASGILATLRHFGALLEAQEGRLNALNVFPVADHDTGTNLRGTVDRLLAELEECDDGGALGPRVARAALVAARGNSGLICSQYLAGFVEVADSRDPFDGAVLANCLATAAVAARAAVARPVEGTMLSVADAAAASAGSAVARGISSAGEAAGLAHRRALLALDETTAQLDVLAAAGVVDAGAAGLVLFLESLAFVHGDATLARPMSPTEPRSPTVNGAARFVGFELQFTADGTTTLADRLRAVLDELGTDVVVSSAHRLVRAHVHVVDVGSALEAVLEHTKPRNIVVEPLMESTERD